MSPESSAAVATLPVLVPCRCGRPAKLSRTKLAGLRLWQVECSKHADQGIALLNIDDVARAWNERESTDHRITRLRADLRAELTYLRRASERALAELDQLGDVLDVPESAAAERIAAELCALTTGAS